MNKTDLAWAAGFFDGEGCITTRLRAPHKGSSLSLQIKQVDRRPLDRFAAIVGVGSVTGPHSYPSARANWRPIYQYAIQSAKGAERVMDLLWPYLSEPKREQYEHCVEEYDSRPLSTAGRG